MITKASIVKLIALVKNEKESIIADNMSDQQAQNFALNISEILDPADVFTPADISAAVGADTVDVLADAATHTPAQVFTGNAGVAKLVAWAAANTTAISADTAGHTALAAWAVANGYTKS